MTTINASQFTYVKFCADLIARAEKLAPVVRADTESGLPQNEGWAFLRFVGSEAAMIVQKSKSKAPQIHSHVDLSGKAGFIELPKKNGKVICHFAPDLDLIEAVLPLFVGASKRATAAAQKATPSVPAVASQAPVVAAPDYSEEDLAAIEAEMFQHVSQ
jgi:hypothetical protein